MSRIDIIGQNGNTGDHYDFVCYQCEKEVNYLFEDGRCKDCTKLTKEEVENGYERIQ